MVSIIGLRREEYPSMRPSQSHLLDKIEQEVLGSISLFYINTEDCIQGPQLEL